MNTVDRRTFLRIGGVAAAAAGVAGIAGCGGSDQTTGSTQTPSRSTASASRPAPETSTSRSAPASTESTAPPKADPGQMLPNSIPYTGVTADLPATADGVEPGFLNFPADNPQLYSQPPGSSKEFTAMIQFSLGTPPALDKNKYWQAINAALGTEMKIVGVPSSEYASKFATTVAGGTLPDVALVRLDTPNLPQLLEAKFQDLTDFVQGDNISKYPALANLSTQRWKSAVVAGRIRGVPQPRVTIKLIFTARTDVCAQKGLDPVIKSGDDFLKLCRGLTDAKKNQWAYDQPSNMVVFVQEMLEAPNVWRQTDGVFESQYTSDKYRQALGFVASMWKEGLFHPDSYSLNNTQNLANIENGTTLVSLYQHYSDYIVGEIQSVVEGYYLTPSVPPKFDGGGTAPQYLSSGVYGLTGIKKASDDRVEEMLRIVDWFSAPFGTKEYILSTYGVKDWDYTRSGSNFSKTDTGKVETGLQVAYIGYAPPVVYVEGNEKATRDIFEYGKATVPSGVLPANIGFYSPTDLSSKSVQLEQMMQDRIRDVITGRKSLEDWDSSVKAWKSGGGDQIAQEYEQSWKQANS